MSIASINPTTGELGRNFERLSEGEIEKQVALAARAFPVFRRSSWKERAKCMLRAVEILEDEKEIFARISKEVERGGCHLGFPADTHQSKQDHAVTRGVLVLTDFLWTRPFSRMKSRSDKPLYQERAPRGRPGR